MDQAKFFARIRATLFDGHISQSQVEGINALLAGSVQCKIDDPDYVAYGLATPYKETDRSMQPIHEYGGTNYFIRRYDVRGQNPELAHRLGNNLPGDGALFHGRGFVQLTGRANYAHATNRLAALGLISPGLDLVASPDTALQLPIATNILWIGMAEGWFTGKGFADYLDDDPPDFRGARRIINGLDCCDEIASAAKLFKVALAEAS